MKKNIRLFLKYAFFLYLFVSAFKKFRGFKVFFRKFTGFFRGKKIRKRKKDVFVYGKGRQKPWFLKQKRNVFFCPGDALQQGSFSAAAGSQNCRDLVFFKFKAEIFKKSFFSLCYGKVLDFYGR